MRHGEQAGDQEDAEQDRRCGRRCEAFDGIEQTTLQRGERDEEEIGKGDAGQLDNQLEFGWVPLEPGRDDAQYQWHEDLARDDESQEYRGQYGEGFRGKIARSLPTAGRERRAG